MAVHAIVNTIWLCINMPVFFHKRQCCSWRCISLFVSFKQCINWNYGVTKAYMYHQVNRNVVFTYLRAFMPAYISSLRIIKFTCAKLRISSSQLSWTYCLFLLLLGKYYFVSLKTPHTVALQKIPNKNNDQYHQTVSWCLVTYVVRCSGQHFWQHFLLTLPPYMTY